MKLRHRPGERGAAVFVVVLVLTLLSAIGVFSMRSAGLVDLASGFNRQNAQSTAIAEYAAKAAATYFTTNPGLAGTTQTPAGCSPAFQALRPGAPCLPLPTEAFEDFYTVSAPVALNDGLYGRLNLDGSLTTVRAKFEVVFTDFTDANAGAAVGNSLRPRTLALRAVGQVFPVDAANPDACSPGSGRALSQQAVRAHLTVPR